MNSPADRAVSVMTTTLDLDRRAIVLAGGSGTRLWPLSRATMPKQLLALNGQESLLQDTMRRLLPMVDSRHVVTVTHVDHRFEVAGQLHAVDAGLAGNVLAEPVGRNTLPAIAWATACIAKENPAAIIGVFSSDHAVADAPAFQAAWRAAEQAASQGQIALFGMEPTEPATGFGYIQAGDEIDLSADKHLPVRKVLRFVEKPDAETLVGLVGLQRDEFGDLELFTSSGECRPPIGKVLFTQPAANAQPGGQQGGQNQQYERGFSGKLLHAPRKARPVPRRNPTGIFFSNRREIHLVAGRARPWPFSFHGITLASLRSSGLTFACENRRHLRHPQSPRSEGVAALCRRRSHPARGRYWSAVGHSPIGEPRARHRRARQQ